MSWQDEDYISELQGSRDDLLDALTNCLSRLEEWTVLIDSEWGSCRDLSEIEAAGELKPEIVAARKAIAKARRS